MFTRVLVGIDGSAGAEVALATAIELGRHFSCTIVLAVVTDLRALQAPLMTTPVLAGELHDSLPAMEGLESALRDRADRLLADAEARVRTAGVAVETVHASGLVTDMLLELAEEAEALVVGRRGETHPGGERIGAETARIIRRSPKPVLIAGERASSGRRPLVAYDGGETSGNALTFAARYAEVVKVPVGVVTVSDDVKAGDELLALAGAYLSGAGVEYTTHRLHGDVATALASHLAASGADLLLLGAHGGRRRRSWSIGSQAEKLMRATSVPVIIVR